MERGSEADKLDNSIIESATREHVFTDFVDSRWRQEEIANWRQIVFMHPNVALV